MNTVAAKSADGRLLPGVWRWAEPARAGGRCVTARQGTGTLRLRAQGCAAQRQAAARARTQRHPRTGAPGPGAGGDERPHARRHRGRRSHRGRHGGSDGHFTAAPGTPTLDGLGVAGDGVRALRERLLLSSPQTRLAFWTAMLTALDRPA